MLAILTTLLSGPIVGLFGKWLTSWMNQKDKKIDLEELKLKHAHELELHKLNQQAKQEEYENEQYITEVNTSAEILKASYEHDNEYGTVPPKWVPWFRAFRPLFTFLLFCAVMVIFYTVGTDQYHITGMTLKEKIVVSVVTMFEIAGTWWFADKLDRLRGNK